MIGLDPSDLAVDGSITKQLSLPEPVIHRCNSAL
jgi:hypothetical protein